MKDSQEFNDKALMARDTHRYVRICDVRICESDRAGDPEVPIG